MNLKLTFYLFFLSTAVAYAQNKGSSDTASALLGKVQSQYDDLYMEVQPFKDSNKPMPRTTDQGNLLRVGIYDWTSGFFPGSLWNIYGLTKNDKWKERALEYTKKLDTIQYWGGSHDVGFIMECSYGNALKYEPSKEYEAIIVQTAKSLATRFKPKAGILQSWGSNDKWECPVIIDNMMNLELLFHATRISGDSTYYNIAVSHADTTLKNHFRKDGSSYHVVDYDTITGAVRSKMTAQGYADESTWARGQAWGLYGYTVCYRETKNPVYLKQAQKIAHFLKNNSNTPKDKVPYWDYDAPVIPDEPRDASAAAILASALYELRGYIEAKEGAEYTLWADEIVHSLSSNAYLAKEGTNKGFLLKHSVGSKPGKSEVDVPLNYADYYFLEALMRQKD